MLLSDAKGVEWVARDDAGDAADSAGYELFPPTVSEKFRPEIHFRNREIPAAMNSFVN